MTAPSDLADVYGDHRRAMALLLHAVRDDTEGARAVCVEAAEAGRWAELSYSLVTFIMTTTPVLSTPAGQAWLGRSVATLAGIEAAR